MTASSLAAALVPAPAGAAGGWQRPIALVAPVQRDVLAPQVAFSPQGAAAIGYSLEDVDDPSSATGFVVQRSAAGQVGRPRRVSGARQVLAIGWRGQTGELLTGASPRGQPCCSSAQAVGLGGGRRRTLVTGLSGATEGRLLALGARMLAVVATERGVWVSLSGPGGRFRGAHRLTASSVATEALDAAALGANQTIVAWAGGDDQPGASAIQTIFVARGSLSAAPGPARKLITVPAGHTVDELALAGGRAAPTVAWIESWSDASGRFRSQVMVADLTRKVAPKRLSSASELAAGLTLAAGAGGEQAVSWKGCDTSGGCSVQTSLRTTSGRFGPVQRLGAIDASEAPAVAVAPGGGALLAWIRGGHVLAAGAGPGKRFGPAHIVSATHFATDLTLAVGPSGNALAVWTQGTLAQTVMGAVLAAG